MTEDGLPLRAGNEGPAVSDLNRRLSAVGFPTGGDDDVFGSGTAAALRAFQSSRRLEVDGVCGADTWSALVEADHRLGDRMLYLRSPMTRGDDVTDLQQRLGSLGFDAGYVDGIFGPDTERALRDFQANQGVPADGVVGPGTVAALHRLAGRRSGEKTVAEVREEENLTHQSGLNGRRIVLGECGGLPSLIDTLARRLRADGAEVLTLHHPDLSSQAQSANDWDGSVYVGLTLADEDFSIAYFETEGFVSYGGRGLATHASAEVSEVLEHNHVASGMRIPVLRETRMPAVWCRIGPPTDAVERIPGLATALRDALAAWSLSPHA